METLYKPFTSRHWLCLLWLILLVLPLRAQTITDVQWSLSANQGLVIRTDGTIATSSIGSRQEPVRGAFIPAASAAVYSLAGDRILSGGLGGGTLVNQPSRPFSGFISGVRATAATTDGGVGYIGIEYPTGIAFFTRFNADFSRGAGPKEIGFEDVRTKFGHMIGTPDGGFVLLVISTDFAGKTVTLVRKYDSALNETWTKTVAYPTPNPATPDRSLTRAKTIINTPDGGFLLAGFYNTTGNFDVPQVGWVAKLNNQGDVVWQKLLDGLPANANPGSIIALQSANDAMLAADGNGYALAGTGIVPSSPASALATSVVELNADGSFKRARAVGTDPSPVLQSFIARYNTGGQGYYAVGTSTGGQPLILLVNPANLNVVTQRTFTNAPAFGTLTALAVAGDGSLVFNTANSALVKLRADTPTGFALLPPTYNCQTGTITFNVSGGDGSPITYAAPGISRSSATSNSGTVEAGLRADPKTIPITATQNGQTSTYVFDLAAFCSSTPPPPPPPPGFTLLAPTYNCQTGGITFNTSGGDGSPITYAAPGVMRASATSNSGTVEAGLRADPKTIPITATQSGQTSTFVFDLPGLCGRQSARVASPESAQKLTLTVLGNPTTTAVSVAVRGAGGQALRLELIDLRGRVLGQRSLERAGEQENHTFDLSQQQAGLFLVRAVSGQQSQTVKVAKQ